MHALIASEALSKDGSRWIAGGSKFLFPVHGLSKMFRAKFLDALETLLEAVGIDLPPQRSNLRDPAVRRRFLQALRRKPWVVYSQKPFAGPRKLLDYLGRYTHRAAISQSAAALLRRGRVRFTYRDRKKGDRRKIAALPAGQFIRRCLKHVLPNGFQRIRHYGLLVNRGKRERPGRCRELLGVKPKTENRDTRHETQRQPQRAADWLKGVLGIDAERCPCCGELLLRETLSPGPPATAFATADRLAAWDTS